MLIAPQVELPQSWMNFSMEKDASQVLARSAVLGMAAFELAICIGISGDPSDMGDADDIAQWMKSVEHWQRFQKK